MTAAARIPLDDDAESWAKVQGFARWMALDGVGVSDDDEICRVWRIMIEQGESAATAINLAPAVIERAREIIAEQETAI